MDDDERSKGPTPERDNVKTLPRADLASFLEGQVSDTWEQDSCYSRLDELLNGEQWTETNSTSAESLHTMVCSHSEASGNVLTPNASKAAHDGAATHCHGMNPIAGEASETDVASLCKMTSPSHHECFFET